MNKFLLSLAILVSTFSITKAQVGIGTNTPHASAVLELADTTKGFLPPRMSATRKNAIASPRSGLIIYQTDSTKGLYIFDGSSGIGW